MSRFTSRWRKGGRDEGDRRHITKIRCSHDANIARYVEHVKARLKEVQS